jgi:hypothetical protein
VQPAVGEGIEKQGSGQAMLEAAGRMRRLVLEIHVDVRKSVHRQGDEMGVRGTVKVSVQQLNGVSGPSRGCSGAAWQASRRAPVQLKAAIPVMARPRMSACTSCVPS